jgi:DnaJ-class molecular chaperone
MVKNAAATTALLCASAFSVSKSDASSTNGCSSSPFCLVQTAQLQHDQMFHIRGGAAPPSENPSRKKKRSKRKESNPQKPSNGAAAADSASSETPATDTPLGASSAEQQSESESQSTSKVVSDILNEDDYYKILGLSSRDVSARQITKAYRRRCLETHPDKSHDRRAFDKVAEAYEVLNDDTNRALYNQYGKTASMQQQQQSAAGFSQAEDLFRSFFGQQPQQQRAYNAMRNRTMRYQLEVTLEDLYAGATKSISVGLPFSTASAKNIQVPIPVGALPGHVITLHGAVDWNEQDVPADFIVTLHQRAHATYTRKNYDLAVAMHVSLKEAVCGCVRSLHHLDGRTLKIKSAVDSHNKPIWIQTGDVHRLQGQGMPKDASKRSFGDLYVQYQVELPSGNKNKMGSPSSTLTDEERVELGRLLDKLEGIVETETEEAMDSKDLHYLQPASPADFGHASGVPRRPTFENDEYENNLFPSFGGRRGFAFHSSFGASTANLFEPDAEESSVQCPQM